jgi:hypothetical protein
MAGPYGVVASILTTELTKVSSSLRVSPTSTGSSKRGSMSTMTASSASSHLSRQRR